MRPQAFRHPFGTGQSVPWYLIELALVVAHPHAVPYGLPLGFVLALGSINHRAVPFVIKKEIAALTSLVVCAAILFMSVYLSQIGH